MSAPSSDDGTPHTPGTPLTPASAPSSQSGGAGRRRLVRRRVRPTSPSSGGHLTPSEGEFGMYGSDSGSGIDLLQDAARDYRRMGDLDVYEKEGLDNHDFEVDHAARFAADADLAQRDARHEARQDGPVALHHHHDPMDAPEPSAEDHAPVDEGVFTQNMGDVPVREWVESDIGQKGVRKMFRDFLGQVVDSAGDSVYEQRIMEMCQKNQQSLVVEYPHLVSAKPSLADWVGFHPAPILEQLNEVAKEMVLKKYPDYGHIHSEIYVRISDLPVVDSIRDLRHKLLGNLIRISGVVTRRTAVFPQLKVSYYNCVSCGGSVGPITHNGDGGAGGRGKDVNVGICPDCQSNGPYTLDSERTVYRNYQRISLQESPGSVPPGRVPRSKEIILLADLVDSCRPGEEIDVTGVYTNTFDAGLNSRQGFPVFATVLEANYLTKQENAGAAFEITPEDERQIKELAKEPMIAERILASLAPSIYGHMDVKMALALSLFGGVEKDINDKHRIRGDLNVLLLGDPGLAKSQFLKYVERTAPRAVFTTGKGASAVGLTAAVHRDPASGEWTLEGGALVLADRGTCLIDEFDKMNDADRTSIHEAMEQQSISISKAGIVTTLRARCGVIAAANPIGGRYDASKTFTENVTLTDPIIQRFDILCVLQDMVDPVEDERLATFVVDSHFRSHARTVEEEEVAAAEAEVAREEAKAAMKLSEAAEQAAAAAAAAATAGAGAGASDEAEAEAEAARADADEAKKAADKAAIAADAAAATAADKAAAATLETAVTDTAGRQLDLIPTDLLKKYLVYARRNVQPSLTGMNTKYVEKLYGALRAESQLSNGIPIAVRHLESFIRMAEAHCRMHLRTVVTDQDVEVAARVLLESFIQAQKYAVQKALRDKFARYLNQGVADNELLLQELKQLFRAAQSWDVLYKKSSGPDRLEVSRGALEERAKKLGLKGKLQTFLESDAFKLAGFRYASKTITRAPL